MPFHVALSGIQGAQTDLNTTANNIANVSTTGFKESRSEFAELFSVSSQNLSNTQIGSGVQVSRVAQQFSQGAINITNKNLDLAISGQGFFTVRDGASTLYTRSGNFGTDKDGYVVNAANQRLQAYPPTLDGKYNAAPQDLQLVTSDNAPKATSAASMLFNLPANATAPVKTPFDPKDSTTFNQSTSFTVYDSLGNAHAATLYFVKQAPVSPATSSTTWEANLYIDGQDATNKVGSQSLTYLSDGTLDKTSTSPDYTTLDFGTYTPATGADDIALTMDVSKSTQYGSNFGVTSVSQDGYTNGRLIDISVGNDGVVNARFTNGRVTPLGALAMASFANPQGLQQVNGSAWSATPDSGVAIYGQAGGSGLGTVQSGALEQSNVDLTAQLVNMITAQRNFQANAQMIQTQDQLQQTIIQIR